MAGVAEGKGWRAHPATRAWEGHADALARYTNACIDEWLARGFRNTMQRLPVSSEEEGARMPWFFGFAPFHFSHRASLLRKDPAHYGAAFAAAAAAEAAGGDADDDALAAFDFVPAEYRALGYVWPHAVPAELRGVAHATAAQLCAPVQAPPRAKKTKARRAQTPEEAVVPEGGAVATPTPRAVRATRRSR